MNVTGNYSYYGQPVMLHEQQNLSRAIREQYKQIKYLENLENLGTEMNIWAYDGGNNRKQRNEELHNLRSLPFTKYYFSEVACSLFGSSNQGRYDERRGRAIKRDYK
jgi:hypothetical protein